MRGSPARGADMSKLVLHIGPHKTATTYLQSNFKRQRGALLKRGWLYPVIGVRTALAHQDVAENPKAVLSQSGPVYASLAAVAREARARRLDVLLSAERFRRWRTRQVSALAGVFQPDELRIVYVLRDPMTVIRSMWAQSVKLGGAASLPEFLARHLDDPARSRPLNPMRDLEPYLELEGASFVILLYDELRRRDEDIYAAFMREALAIGDAAPTSDLANARPPVELTEFQRLMTIVAGFESRPELLDVGDAVRLLFSPEERDEIAATIREHGAAARRTIHVARDIPAYETLEANVRLRLSPHLRPAPPDGRLFPATEESWTHYDAGALMAVPAIRALVETSARRLRPGSPPLAIMTGGRRMVLAGRRLRNLVTRG